MYQITRITDRDGAVRTEGPYRERTGCMGECRMEDGCVLIHCRYDRRGEPCDRYIRTSLVQNWRKDRESGRVTVETLNSVYVMDHIKTD